MLTKLFISFLKIGAFTFGGGYAMIPLIENEVIERNGWIGRNDFLDLLTLAQSAPGPISLNVAVFVGYKMRGWRGAVASTLGIIIPSFVTILVIAIFFNDFRNNPTVDSAFKGMRPAVVALMLAPLAGLARGLEWWKIAVAVVAAGVVWRLGVSPIYIIVLGALWGIGYTFWKGGAK